MGSQYLTKLEQEYTRQAFAASRMVTARSGVAIFYPYSIPIQRRSLPDTISSKSGEDAILTSG